MAQPSGRCHLLMTHYFGVPIMTVVWLISRLVYRYFNNNVFHWINSVSYEINFGFRLFFVLVFFYLLFFANFEDAVNATGNNHHEIAGSSCDLSTLDPLCNDSDEFLRQLAETPFELDAFFTEYTGVNVKVLVFFYF